MPAILSRNREYALLGGVCGGLAVFLGVNPLVVRLFFILLVFGQGIGIILYLILWIILPLDGQVYRLRPIKNGETSNQSRTEKASLDIHFLGIFQETQGQFGILVGFALIFVGIFYLLSTFQFSLPGWLNFDLIWPCLLLFGGLALLFRRPRGVDFHD